MSTSTEARPTVTTIKTLRQFAADLVRDVATENGLTYTEVRTELHPGHIEDSWWNYATAAFANGADFSRTTWRALDPWQRTVILRSHRAQNDDDLRRTLLGDAPTIPRLAAGDPLSPHYLTPEAEALFEAMWLGERSGNSEAAVTFRLAGHEADLEKVRAGRISPARIIGTGYKKPKAICNAWADAEAIEAYFLAAAKPNSASSGES